MAAVLAHAPRRRASSLRGLFVREAIANDHGTWMLRAAAAEPDIVRVEVRAGAAQAADRRAEANTSRRARELERVLEHGGALPPNPDVLLPVTRTLDVARAAAFWRKPFEIEIEDFATGWVDRGTLRDVPSAIRRAGTSPGVAAS